MALARQPNYAGTGFRTFYEFDEARQTKALRLKLMQQQCALIGKVIFLPSVLPRSRSLLHLSDVSRRTMIGQRVFSLVRDSVVLDTPTGPIILARPQNHGAQTWRLEYDPELADDQLSSLQTDQDIIWISYDTNSTQNMASFRELKEHYQQRNAGMFNRFPQEVRNRIYEYAAGRAFAVEDPESYQVTDAFEFRDPVTKRLPAAKPSVLLNLQLTCSYFHDDVTQFLYDENEFYFSCPDSVEHFLLCLDGGPFNVNPVRHLGVVILDLRRCISFPDTGYAWPALPLKKMEDKHATPDWDGHLGRLPTKTTGHVLRRLEHFKGMKAQVGEKELERWTNAVTRMLENNTIGKLVIRGDPDWCSVLFSTSPLVKALLEFNGKGRINKVYKAGKWPRNAGDKVLQMLKDTLEGDVEEGSEAKHKKTMQSKKRKRASKAAEEPTQGLAISDDGE